LEDYGFIRHRRGFLPAWGPRTFIQITPEGEKAIKKHLERIRSLANSLVGSMESSMAIRDEFAGPKTRPEHIAKIKLTGTKRNNKMERMNGEIRDREKTMRSIKTIDSPILKGLQIYHNLLRPNQGLGGKTPAEKAGITIEGKNPWLTL
jgi:hypothetical protein